MSDIEALRAEIYRHAPGLEVAEALFESMDDVVYCVKNRRRQYIAVNSAFVVRVRLRNRAALLGRTARELFPMPLAAGYEQQDETVFSTGREIRDRMERVTETRGGFGWFLAHKVPIRDESGYVIAVAGISRDLGVPADRHPEYAAVASAIEMIQCDCSQAHRIEDLARQVGMTRAQFDRRVRSVLHISPRQFLTKTRIDAAAELMREVGLPMAEIALRCGFYDQATFCRQFRAATGLTPRQYREIDFRY
jgi:AraC-like DNA-binding protein